jgi:hypothetical protein
MHAAQVYTPSDWDPALGARSAELPSSRLVLDFIHGYAGALPPGWLLPLLSPGCPLCNPPHSQPGCH